MTAWKNAERRAAGLVDGKRHVRTSRHEAAPDVDGGRFSVEAKWRTRLPKLLTGAMAQAERFASPGRPPLVVIFEKRKRSGFAVMRTDDFRRLFKGQDTMLENVTAQDLPTSFRVKPVETDVNTVQQLVNYYRKQPGVFEVSAATEVIRQLKGMSDFLNQGLTVFGALLLAASALLILNTVRTAMFARRREIEVMKLVGATNWFIRIPFMLEGLIQGLLGGALAIGFVFMAQRWIDDLIDRGPALDLLQPFAVDGGDVALACITVGAIAVVLSVLSSTLATRRFLDV